MDDPVRIDNYVRPLQGWHSEMLRLHDQGMSDRAIPELFHRIPSSPLPPFSSPGQGGGWSQRAQRAWASRPWAEPPLGVPPLHLGLRHGRCYNFFAFSPAVSPLEPPNPCLPLLSSWGPAHLPAGSPTVLWAPGGARGRARGWRVGRRRKGKQRQEKLGGGRNQGLERRGESEDGGEHFLEVTTSRLRLARLSWGRGSEGGAGRARRLQEVARHGPDLPRAPRCGRAGLASAAGRQT